MRKRILTIVLSLIMVVSAVYAAYQQPKQVKAAVVVDDALIIAGLLAALGYATSITAFNNWKSWEDTYPDPGTIGHKQREEAEDLINRSFEHWVNEAAKEQGLIDENGAPLVPGPDGDGDGSPDNENNDDWNLLDSVKAFIKKAAVEGDIAGTFVVGAGLWSMLGEWGDVFKGGLDGLAGDALDGAVGVSPIPENFEITGSAYLIITSSSGSTRYYFGDVGYIEDVSYKYFFVESFSGNASYYETYRGVEYDYGKSGGWSSYIGDSSYETNFPIVSSDLYDAYDKMSHEELISSLSFDLSIGRDSVFEGSNRDTYPAYPDKIVVPTWSQVSGLAYDVNDASTDTDKQTVIDQYLNDLNNVQPSENSGTGDGTEGGDSTDPDSGTDPGTGTTPGTGDGTGSDTDTDTGTNTGDMTVEDAQQNLDKNQFLLPDTITEKFPFCVPFDIIRAFQLFNSDTRTAPKVELPLKTSAFIGEETVSIDEKLVIDLSVFDEVAELLRTLELIGFIVALALVSRDLIKG